MDKSKQRIIQWNCRGIKPRYEELLLLLSLLGPSVFCLQETFLKTDDNFTFKGFNVYNHIHSDCARASGGSSILVKTRSKMKREFPVVSPFRDLILHFRCKKIQTSWLNCF